MYKIAYCILFFTGLVLKYEARKTKFEFIENMDNLLNVNQVAFILKVHPLTIRRYIKEGKLKAIRAGGNVRIRESDLQAFNNKPIEPKQTGPFLYKEKRRPFQSFNNDDPFFRLQGRGASLNLS